MKRTEAGTSITISLGGFEGPRLQRKLATMMLSRGGKQVEGNLRGFAALAEADWAERWGSSEAPVVELTADTIRRAARPQEAVPNP